jgi:hypothetical protein
MEQSLFFFVLGYPPRSAVAGEAWDYIARAHQHSEHPDAILHLEDVCMPGWGKDGAYWLAADAFTRKDGRKFFDILAALPRQLPLSKQIELAREFAIDLSYMAEVPYGRLPITFGIHAGYGRNPHIHLLESPCIADGIARSPEKWFGRHNPVDPSAGGTQKDRGLTHKRFLLALRETWEAVGNRLFQRWGYPIYFDRRSWQDQGLDKIPSLHLGPEPQPGRPNPGREQRKKRNEEIAEENDRKIRELAEQRERVAARARAALAQLDDVWANLQIPEVTAPSTKIRRSPLDARPLIKAWSTSATPGVRIRGDNLIDRWGGLADLVREPAYQFAAGRQLGAGWDCALCDSYLIWTHAASGTLVDAGGVVLAQDTTEAQAEAIASLLWSRGAKNAKVRGPTAWRQLVASALGRLGIQMSTPPKSSATQSAPGRTGRSGVRP